MKSLKYFLIISLVLLLLVILGLATLVWVTEPNDYKPQIIKIVKETTGRDLTIPGDIHLSVFPWLGLALGEISLSNAEGFKQTAFATVAATDIRVAVWPLIRRWELQAGVLKVKGLRLHLERNAQGVSNWDDLLPSTRQADAATDKPALVPPGFEIGSVQIEGASIQWRDQQAATEASLDNLNVRIGKIRLNQPLDLVMEFAARSQNPTLQAMVKLSGQVTPNLDTQVFEWSQLSARIDAHGEALPFQQQLVQLQTALMANLSDETFVLKGAKLVLNAKDSALPSGAQIIKMDFDAMLNLGAQTAEIRKAQMHVMGITLDVSMNARRIIDQPEASGSLKIQPFSPRELLVALGEEVPVTADANVLQRLQGGLQFSGNLQQAALTQMLLQLDDTQIKGSVDIKDLDQAVMAYDFQLILDDMDADRYLPPLVSEGVPSGSAPANAGTLPAAADDERIELPVEALRTLDVKGSLKVDRFKMMNLKMQNFASGIKIKNGLLMFDPMSVDLYQGHYQGSMRLDVREEKPRYDLDIQLANVDAMPLLKDFMGDAMVEGRLGLKAHLATGGDTVNLLKQKLNGQLDFSLQDGALAGINLGEKLREAQAKLRRQPYVSQGAKKTDFAATSGNATIRDGLVTFNAFKLEAPAVRASIGRTANLVTEALDLHIDAYVVDTKTGQAGKNLDELKVIYIPVEIKGTFTAPAIAIDETAFLKALLGNERQKRLEVKTQAVEQKQQEVREQAKEKLEEKQEDLKDKLKQKLKLKF